MADFNELLESLRNPGEEGPSESIYDDIANAYNHDIEIRDSKISDSEKAIQDAQAEISRLKSANYDLMIQSSDGDNTGSDDGDDTDDEDTSGIDDLFD